MILTLAHLLSLEGVVSQAKNIDIGQTEMFMYILHSRKLISCPVRNLKLSLSKNNFFVELCYV